MSTSIIHVGVDDCQRIPVLKSAGFQVNPCDSFDQLHSALAGIPPADAVAIAECRSALIEKAVALTRATSSIPLILFQGTSPHTLNDSDFDLVVPVLTSPQIWIARMQAMIEESRTLRARSEAIREASSLLTQASAALRGEAKTAREKSHFEQVRAKSEVERNRPG